MTLKRYRYITFQYSEEGAPSEESQVRGIGTDVGIVSCMVFLAQFILSLSMVCTLCIYMYYMYVIYFLLKRGEIISILQYIIKYNPKILQCLH